MKTKNLIPLTDYGYIDYKDSVYIIRRNSNGNEANLQVEGVMCKQASIKGFLEYSFKSKLKYFQPDFWYKGTSWATDPNKKYFDTKKLKKQRPHVGFSNSQKAWDKVYKYADEFGKPLEDILKAIKKEVESNIKQEITFDFTDTANGWCEAYIPILIKNKKYLLTWENCD